MSWPAAPLCAPRAAGPNLPILARGLRGCPGRASGGLGTWGPIFGGKSGFRALSPRAQKRTYSGALARTHSRDTGHEAGGRFRPNLFLKSSKKQVLWGILTPISKGSEASVLVDTNLVGGSSDRIAALVNTNLVDATQYATKKDAKRLIERQTWVQ